MHVTWDPEDGGDVVVLEFKPDDDLGSKEAEDIEKIFGAPIEQWMNELRMKSAKARRLLLWWMLRQNHRKLAFKDTPDFKLRQMKVEMDVQELQELWKRLSRMKMDEGKLDDLRAAFEVDVRDAMEREGVILGDIPGEEIDILEGNRKAPTS
jgi:hypothetical protein